jgi:hypothetical protein
MRFPFSYLGIEKFIKAMHVLHQRPPGWYDQFKQYEEWDSHEILRLDEICRLLMDVRKDEAALRESGSIFIDRYHQPKEKPESSRLRANRTLLMRMIRDTGLDLKMDDPRPPRRY